ncbi:hypothetical protein B7463_g6816, partial [Scytalidium lignicola]
MPISVDGPQTIILTNEERDSGIIGDKKLYDAVEAFFKDGLVVIENAIDVTIINRLNERMLQDTEKLLSGGGNAQFNHLNKDPTNQGAAKGGNLSQVPPIEKGWFFPEIYGNKHGANIISHILGPHPEVHFIRSNTLLATDDRQLVHADILCQHPEHPFGIVLNTFLVDVGIENGTTEIWLGTQNTNMEYHRKVGDPSISEDKHAGMPNPTNETRIMLAIVYYAAWYKNGLATTMPESLRPIVENLEVSSKSKIAVKWVPDEGYNYLNNEFSRNFSSTLTPWIWEEIEKLEETRECTRRKIKCDKQIPCSRCRRMGARCIRERVMVSSVAARHGQELSFLKQLEKKLRSPKVKIIDISTEISQRIAAIQDGKAKPSEIFPASKQYSREDLANSLPVEVLDSKVIRTGRNGSDKVPEYAATVTLESLAWGRHYGACYPHRHCNCYSYRSPSEIISISSDLSNLPPGLANQVFTSQVTTILKDPNLLPSISDSTKLVNFHITHLAWHHGTLHAPTFLEQCEIFWSTGKPPHSLWVALYLAVLSSTMWSIQNSIIHQRALSIFVEEDAPRNLFLAMVETLYSEKFLEYVSMYSIQAIAISTEVAHNLGLSDLNATLVAAGIRLSQCIGLHKIIALPPSEIETTDRWHETVERELGKRIWCQLVIQDHFGLCFTDSYNINPKHCLTELPRNCDDYDLKERGDNIPTITSYIRTLAHMATLVPRLFDELGPLWSRKPLREQYQDVINGDREMRCLVGDIPSFLLREDTTEQSLKKPWLDIARRSLAITAAEKIILIHRPFLFPSFQTARYPHTRSTCVGAATTIVREYANIVAADHISLWTHTAYCVTASIVLCLQLLYPQNDLPDQNGGEKVTLAQIEQKYCDLVSTTRKHLANRRGDVIATRGVRLIDTILSVGGFGSLGRISEGVSIGQSSSQDGAPNVHIDLREVVAQFLTEDQTKFDLSVERWDYTTNVELPLDMDVVDVDFDTWFEGVFGEQGI